MLCVVSCSSGPRPSVQPATGTALGNAYRLLLPPGTAITLPDAATAAQVRAIAYNELSPIGHRQSAIENAALTLRSPMQLVSPAYIAERNATELRLLRELADAKAERARTP